MAPCKASYKTLFPRGSERAEDGREESGMNVVFPAVTVCIFLPALKEVEKTVGKKQRTVLRSSG